MSTVRSHFTVLKRNIHSIIYVIRRDEVCTVRRTCEMRSNGWTWCKNIDHPLARRMLPEPVRMGMGWVPAGRQKHKGLDSACFLVLTLRRLSAQRSGSEKDRGTVGEGEGWGAGWRWTRTGGSRSGTPGGKTWSSISAGPAATSPSSASLASPFPSSSTRASSTNSYYSWSLPSLFLFF